MNIESSVALVTGGADRVGRAIAIHLAQHGASVAIHYHTSATKAKETVEKIRQTGGNAYSFCADFQDQDAVASLIQQIYENLGTTNILINNASVFRQRNLLETMHADIQESLAVHLNAPFKLSQDMVAHLEKAPGKIININDTRQTRPNQFAYGVGKAALSGLTRSLASSVGLNVQVNEIALGAILPPSGMNKQRIEELARASAAKRLGTLNEVTHLVEALILNDFINGETIHLDGGRVGTQR